MYVIIVGGGKVGYQLTRRLIESKHEVLLIEKDKARCQKIQEELGEVVLWGDGCEMRIMEDAGMERADVVAAVTGHDEDNLIVSQMAKRKFKVPRVIARINNPKNEETFLRLGITDVIDSTKIIYMLIDQEVEVGDLVPLMALAGGKLEIVQVELDQNSPVAGKLLKELTFPGDSLIISVIRDNNVILPKGETTLQAGDTLIAITKPEYEAALHDTLLGKRAIKR